MGIIIQIQAGVKLRLCVHPFDSLSAPCGSHERIGKVLCFPRNFVVPELHDAYGDTRSVYLSCAAKTLPPRTISAKQTAAAETFRKRRETKKVLPNMIYSCSMCYAQWTALDKCMRTLRSKFCRSVEMLELP